jgi:hypothetical protein
MEIHEQKVPETKNGKNGVKMHTTPNSFSVNTAVVHMQWTTLFGVFYRWRDFRFHVEKNEIQQINAWRKLTINNYLDFEEKFYAPKHIPVKDLNPTIRLYVIFFSTVHGA